MSAGDAERFWDARAKEDAFFFVDNRLRYKDPDVERFWAEGERDLDWLLDQVDAEIAASDVSLDIGCGVGRLTRVLAGRASRVVSVDVSAEMLARAQELNAHLDNVEWVHGDGTSLHRVDDASIDSAISLVVFQHIPDPHITLGYIGELGRVLRPGGWAAFQVSTNPEIHRHRRGPRERVLNLLGRSPRGQDHPAWLGSAVDLEDLRAAANDGGLDVERIEQPGSQFCLVLVRRRAA